MIDPRSRTVRDPFILRTSIREIAWRLLPYPGQTVHRHAIARPTCDRMDIHGNWPPAEHIIIELRNLAKSFGPNQVLRGISLQVPRGSSAVVLGASGSGKSVLIRHIVGLLLPDSGEVWLCGQRVDRLRGRDLDRLRLSVGYLFQGGALFDSMTVYENLSFSLERHTRLDRQERDLRIRETLAWVEMDHAASSYPAELSGGQQRRVGIARAIVLHPDVLLYDEPTTGLDPVIAGTVAELIVRLHDERHITSITITHDLSYAAHVADQVHFLNEGRFVAEGTFEQVRTSNHPAVQAFFR